MTKLEKAKEFYKSARALNKAYVRSRLSDNENDFKNFDYEGKYTSLIAKLADAADKDALLYLTRQYTIPLKQALGELDGVEDGLEALLKPLKNTLGPVQFYSISVAKEEKWVIDSGTEEEMKLPLYWKRFEEEIAK